MIFPEANCRTCAHATPEIDEDETWARWSCARHKCDLIPDEQRKGCADHVLIPGLVKAEMTAASEADNWVEYKTEGGTTFRNGNGFYSSAELHAGGFQMIEDEIAAELKKQVGSLSQRAAQKSEKKEGVSPVEPAATSDLIKSAMDQALVTAPWMAKGQGS